MALQPGTFRAGPQPRRAFLRTASATVAALALAACSGGDDDAGPQTGGSSVDPASIDSNAELDLAVVAATLEYLSGPGRWISFGLTTIDRSPVADDAEVLLSLRRVPTEPDQTAEVVLGPIPASFSPAVDTGQGVWYAKADLPDPGIYEMIAQVGDTAGLTAIQVVDAETTSVRNPATGEALVPGMPAVVATTPTTEDDLGVFSICTQDPTCGMHEMSLDEALTSGRPVVMMFATPQFCQTAVCGPGVETLDEIRTGGDWGDTVFIHSEIFAEEPGATEGTPPLAPAVEAWGLPTEPWFFTIDRDGMIVDRIDGPMPMPVLADLVEQLQEA